MQSAFGTCWTRLKRPWNLPKHGIAVTLILKDMEIIGEAGYQVSDSTRQQLTDIPWDDIIGMRHRLVHAYFDIDLDILWRTVEHDLPPLICLLEKHLLVDT